MTGASPYTGKLGKDDPDNKDMAYRVIADHIRTLSFAIADGSRPGNEGREYVLRRILRRAVRYGREVLKAREGFFSGLVDVVARTMGDVFPEVRKNQEKIKHIIAEEEESFGKTLVKGIERFKKAASEVTTGGISGHDAFVLWDTFGFPIDLTQLMAEERGLQVDVAGYKKEMEEARERARNARGKAVGGHLVLEAEATAALQKRSVQPTNDEPKFTWYKDYPTSVKAIFSHAGFVESTAIDGLSGEFGLVLESTSFYAEQGGQIYDTGSVVGPNGSFEVKNVQLYGGYVLHMGSISSPSGKVSVGDEVVAKVDYARRSIVAPNHTCTHLLNYALRRILGDHVDQKGSLVAPDKLRFDFSHGKVIDPEALGQIEAIVVQQIKDALPVYAKEASLVEARKILGLRAVFGEVYPDPVRIVAVGKPVEELLANPQNSEWQFVSTELCGGTHIANTKDAKAFALVQEEGIAKGVRRIIALTTDAAKEAIALADSYGSRISEASKKQGAALEKEVASIRSSLDVAIIPAVRKAEFRKQLQDLQEQIRKTQKAAAGANLEVAIHTATSLADAAVASGKTFVVARIDVGVDATAVREAVVAVLDKQKDIAVMIVSVSEAKKEALVYAGVPDSLTKRGFAVVEWLKKTLEPINGKGGGGKGGLAQGRGSNLEGLEKALDVATLYAEAKLAAV